MVGILSAQNTALTLLRTGGGNVVQSRNKKETATQTDPLVAALEKTNPQEAHELKRKLEESRNILKRLESSKQDVSEQRRAAAAEKIQQIKEKLKAFRLLMPVDPEAVARQVKQLARELAQAVREYARAGGGGADASLQAGVTGMTILAGADANTANAANTVTPEDAAGAAGEMASTEAAGITGAVAAALPQTEDGAKSESTEKASETGSDDQVKTNPETARLSLEEIQKQKEEDREVLREQIQSQITQANKAVMFNRPDFEFANEVRNVKDSLKNTIDIIKRSIEDKDSSGVNRNIESAEDALREVGKSLNVIRSDSATSTIGIVNVLT